MTAVQYASGFILINGLIAAGFWLQTIGPMTDLADRLFRPVPLGLFGLAVIAIKSVLP